MKFQQLISVEPCRASVFVNKPKPVGAPGDGGDEPDIREKDGIISDAIQCVVHLTEWLSVQLELELHLTPKTHTHTQLTKQPI